MVKKIRTRSAFTLVELMIVIAIIGILAAALFPSMSNYLARAHNRAIIEEMRRIGIAANTDFIDFGSYAPDVAPSNCQMYTGVGGYSGTNLPRFVTRGMYPLEKYKNSPKNVNPAYCFDWQNWDANPNSAGWASIDLYDLVGTTEIVIKRMCFFQGRFDSNILYHCENSGIDP